MCDEDPSFLFNIRSKAEGQLPTYVSAKFVFGLSKMNLRFAERTRREESRGFIDGEEALAHKTRETVITMIVR